MVGGDVIEALTGPYVLATVDSMRSGRGRSSMRADALEPIWAAQQDPDEQTTVSVAGVPAS